jgi:hypothetical protein
MVRRRAYGKPENISILLSFECNFLQFFLSVHSSFSFGTLERKVLVLLYETGLFAVLLQDSTSLLSVWSRR